MASAALGDTGLQWRLEASIQVRCAIVDLSVPADRPKELAIATMCNAQRYQLVIGKGTMQAGVISAKSSAGPVQISGNVVTIDRTRQHRAAVSNASANLALLTKRLPKPARF
jgi:hypothetical protein